MKIKKPIAPGPAITSHRGAFEVAVYGDKIVAKKWKRKRGRALQGYDGYRQLQFGIAAYWASHVEPLQYETAVEMAKGTQQVPRDILMMAMMGTYYEFLMPDGSILQGARMTNPNPQYILDLITDEIGSLLWRAPVGWVGITPGYPGQVLVLAPDGEPNWVDGAGGGGINYGSWTPTVEFSTTPPTGLTYSHQFGTYFDFVGANLCMLQFNVGLSSKGSGGAGSLRIAGIPFTSDPTTNFVNIGALTTSNLVIGTAIQTYPSIQPNSDLIGIASVVSNTTPSGFAYSAVQNNFSVAGNIWYQHQ